MSRPRLVTAVAALATLTILACHPTLAKSIGADVWNVPALNDQLRESTGASERLDIEDDEIKRRIDLKETIIEELLAGRITLAEATAKFTELNATRPKYMEAIRASFPGATDQEKAARNVISYSLTRTPVDTRAAVSQKFDAELEKMIALSGTH